MGLDTMQSRRDRAKLKWWYKLATLPEDRYPKQLFNQKWNIKPLNLGRYPKQLFNQKWNIKPLNLGFNVSNSAHNCGCVINGSNTITAI